MASEYRSKDIFPEEYDIYSISQFTPQQQKLFRQLFSHVGKGSYLDELARGDETAFAKMEAPAMKQYAGLQGGISSRFGRGGGAMSSQAAKDFAMNLKGQRMNMRIQAIMDLMGISNRLLAQRPVERGLVESEGEGIF